MKKEKYNSHKKSLQNLAQKILSSASYDLEYHDCNLDNTIISVEKSLIYLKKAKQFEVIYNE